MFLCKMYNWRLFITIAVTTAGASFQFYSYGAINTPQLIVENWINTTYTSRYNSPLSASTLTLLWSITVGSAPLGAIIGSILTRFMAERCGRKQALVLNGYVTIVGGIFEVTCKLFSSPEMFIVGRLLLGLSNGLATGMVPLFLTEIAPVSRRGAAATAHQIVVAFADWFSLLATLPELLGSERLWPVAFAFPAIPAVILVLILPFAHESPRYLLMTKDDRAAAEKSVRFYTTSEVDYQVMFNGLITEAAFPNRPPSGRARLIEFFKKRELRTPLIISIMVMTAQQFTGCAAVFSYSTNIFMQASLPKSVAELSTLGIGICYFLFTLPSPYFIEHFGRRKLSLFQLTGCLIFLITLTVFITLRNTYQLAWASYGSIGALVAYMCVYGVGSSVPWIITTEMYEQEYRSLGVSIGTFVAWFWALVVSTAYYPFQQAVGIEASFMPFIIVLFLAILGMFVLLPETKNKTIADIVREFRKRRASASFVAVLGGTNPTVQDGMKSELAPLLEETGEFEERYRTYEAIRSG